MVDTRIGPEGTSSIRLNGSGNGTAKLGPLSAREVWYPDNVHVQVSTNVNEAQCTIYVGDAAIQRNFRDATYSGSSGDSSDKVNGDTVKVGTYIFAVWTGGDANAIATLNVTGRRTI